MAQTFMGECMYTLCTCYVQFKLKVSTCGVHCTYVLFGAQVEARDHWPDKDSLHCRCSLCWNNSKKVLSFFLSCFWTFMLALCTQLPSRLFSPSEKWKKLSQKILIYFATPIVFCCNNCLDLRWEKTLSMIQI